MGDRNDFAAIIMAAGQGKRMKNPDTAKVLYEVGGKPMIGHVVELANSCHASPIVVIIGHQRESVRDYLDTLDGNIVTCIQDPQLGTGHAVMQAEQALAHHHGDVIVLSGDVPLLRPATISNLLKVHKETGASVTVLTAEMPDPTGYGRIVRRDDESVEKIVEHRDASEAELEIREINSGIYVFKTNDLFSALKKLNPHNAQAEYYLTDVFGIFRSEGKRISAVTADDRDEINGVNTVEQLERVNEWYGARTT
jgi:UDP-N-acetylglucosamine diphosphorylase/glucosamine-1-phosphate N-acetyltransferase